MPHPVQVMTYAIPFRYFLEIVRAIFLKGVGVSILWPQMAALTVLAFTLTGLSVAAMSRRL